MKAPHRGFTLIELMVVVAIITALAGFLFPVILSARRMGWRINCAANLKQIGQACIQYAKDHDQTWPNEWWYWTCENLRNSGRTLGLLYPVYIEEDDLEVFVCPAARNEDKIPTFEFIMKWGDKQLDPVTNVPLNVFNCRASYAYHRPKTRTWVEKIIMAADEDAIGTDYLVNSIDPDTGEPYPPSPNHRYKGANCLWIDGHVTWEECDNERVGIIMRKGVYGAEFGFGMGSGQTEPMPDTLGKSDVDTDWEKDLSWTEDTRCPNDIYLRISPDNSTSPSP